MTLKNAASDANDVFLCSVQCTSILVVVSSLKAVMRYVNYCTYERKHDVSLCRVVDLGVGYSMR